MKIRWNILCPGELGGLCCQWSAYHQNLDRIDEMKHLPGAWIWKTFHVSSSPPCWWTVNKRSLIARFVCPPTFVHFTIVICVSRDCMKTTYCIILLEATCGLLFISRYLQQKMSRYSLRVFWSLGPLRACLHGGGGPQVGEITCEGSPHLSCKRDHIKMRDYMDRQVTRPKRVTSPTLGPPPSCKQALVRDVCKNGCQLAQWKQWSFSTYAVIVGACTVVIK